MVKKVFLMAIIIGSILFSFSNGLMAAVNVDNIKDDVTVSGADTVKSLGEIVFSIVTTVGTVASVLVISIIGIKYMLGSVDERAKYKESLMPYFIGSILLFGASTIADILYKVMR